jgi:4-hydroxy-3-polyprenylbenzoate decarboxylase
MKEPQLNDLRDWIRHLETAGQLKRITAQVDWDEEIGAIVRKVSAQEGPALLFENIKGYPKKEACAAGCLRTEWVPGQG